MSFHLQSECDYDEWMFENYPGYSILDAFQALKPYYLNTPFENAYESDVEYSSDGSSPRMESDLSNCSFLPLDPDEDEFGLDLYYPELDGGMETPLEDFPQEGSIPISLWYDESVEDLSDSDSSDDSDLATPVNEEADDLQELRCALFKAFEADPLGCLVSESLAALDDGLRASPIECFEEICWASQRRMSFVPSKEPTDRVDVPEEAFLPDDLDIDQVSISRLSDDDISFSPSRPLVKVTDNGFKRFAKRLRIDSFGRRRAAPLY